MRRGHGQKKENDATVVGCQQMRLKAWQLDQNKENVDKEVEGRQQI